MMRPSGGKSIDLQTERFLVRSLKPGDASDRWRGWARDPEVMGPLNAPVRDISRHELANYIATFNQGDRYLLGIFDKPSGGQIGFFMIDVERAHLCASFNAVVGEKAWWGKNVVNEARGALLDYFFSQEGMEKACGVPLARNFPAVFNYKAQGWRHEGTLRGQCRSVRDGTRLDQYQFGLLRTEWIARRAGMSNR